MKKCVAFSLIFILLLTGCQSGKDTKTLFLTEFFTSGSEERYTDYMSQLSIFQEEDSNDEEVLTQIAVNYHKGIYSMVSPSCFDEIILSRMMLNFDQLAVDNSCTIVPEKITFKSIGDSSWDFKVTLKSTENEKYSGGIVTGQIKTGEDGLVSSLWITSLNSVLKEVQP